ncbi:hypothetical protein FS749_013924 [Ceratobasidium sp. UAMH 11750]|nr:hypothetical protein FS749_013924 [Ceratobasidium sp. UAMH 11750]
MQQCVREMTTTLGRLSRPENNTEPHKPRARANHRSTVAKHTRPVNLPITIHDHQLPFSSPTAPLAINSEAEPEWYGHEPTPEYPASPAYPNGPHGGA